jgi:hypothetical protein
MAHQQVTGQRKESKEDSEHAQKPPYPEKKNIYNTTEEY